MKKLIIGVVFVLGILIIIPKENINNYIFLKQSQKQETTITTKTLSEKIEKTVKNYCKIMYKKGVSMKNKKVLIGIVIAIMLLLCIAHNEINTIVFLLTTNEGLVAEDIIESDTPKEVKKMVKKEINLKFFGHKVMPINSIMIDVCQNPNPEVLKTILDDKEIKKILDKNDKDTMYINTGIFNIVIYSKNAPEKVKILLEHGYNPYTINPQNNKSAMDNIQKNYDKIDPNVIKVINDYYKTNKRS